MLHPYSTIEDLFRSYFDHALTNFDPDTQAQYNRNFARWIMPSLGNQPIAELTAQGYEDFLDHLRNTSSKLRISRISSLMKKMYNYAVEMQLVYANPCHTIPYHHWKYYYTKQIYTEDEFLRIIKAIKGSSLENYYGLALTTGLRPAELNAISTECILANGGKIRIDCYLRTPTRMGGYTIKNMDNYGMPRIITLCDIGKEYLSNQLRIVQSWREINHWTSPDNLIFDDPDRRQLTCKFILNENKRIRSIAGVQQFSIQMLRDNYCINALKRNVNHKALQIHMGYGQPHQMMTLFYGAANPVQHDLAETTNEYYSALMRHGHDALGT